MPVFHIRISKSEFLKVCPRNLHFKHVFFILEIYGLYSRKQQVKAHSSAAKTDGFFILGENG